jgi:hypothetical protein
MVSTPFHRRLSKSESLIYSTESFLFPCHWVAVVHSELIRIGLVAYK